MHPAIVFGVLAVLGLLVVWVVLTCNRLVHLRNRRDGAAVLREVTEARAAVARASGPAESSAADERLTGALRSLFAVSEAYPDLEASENFLSLQSSRPSRRSSRSPGATTTPSSRTSTPPCSASRR